MNRKMTIFEKSNPMNPSTKIIIFCSILVPIFWTYFELHPNQQSSQPFNMSLMTPKKSTKPQSMVTESAPLDSSDEEDTTSQLLPAKAHRMMHISWTTAQTEWLLDWLEENPVNWQKLFSDSTKDAKDEGWQKHVAKGTKSEFHKLIAFFVFSVDVDKEVWDDFAVNGGNYTKSIDNYLGQYIFFLYLLVYTHQPSLGCERSINYSMKSWAK